MRHWLLASFALCLSTASAQAQGYQCRTSPNGASTAYCSSEAFVTQHFPGSSTTGHIATFADGTGQKLQDGGGPPFIVGPTNPQSGNYSITSSSGDCYGIVLASGGQKTITLAAASGFPEGCLITLKDDEVYTGSTGRGKILAGAWPADLDTILYPQQVTQIRAANGNWSTVVNPGRWKNPTTVTIHVDINGANTNDGLATGAGGAVADAQAANTRAIYRYDTQQTTPIIAMACSQNHTVSLNMGGTPLGSNLIQLSPDGNCSFTWTTNGPAIAIADLAELDLNLTFYGSSGSFVCKGNRSNAPSTGCILLHNAVVLDQEGTPEWDPAGANDNYLFCDGPCVFTIANGLNQGTAAGGNRAIVLNEGGKGTQSGVIDATASGSLNGIFSVFGGGLLIRGTSDGATAHWASIGASTVYGNGTVVTNGTTTAGGVTTVGGTGASCASLAGPC